MSDASSLTAEGKSADMGRSSTPVQPKSHRTAFFIAGAIVLAALIGVVIVGGFSLRNHCAKTTVQLYFTALQKGDANTAINLTDAPIELHGEPLLTNSIYSKATDRPHDAKIASIHWSGLAAAKINVAYAQGSQKITDSLTVYRTGGHWRIKIDNITDGPCGYLYIYPSYASHVFLINDQSVMWYTAQARAAFPGTYTIKSIPRDKWVTSTTTSATVSSGNQANGVEQRYKPVYSPQYTPTPALTTTVDQQVRDVLNQCASQNSIWPQMSGQFCPFHDSVSQDREAISVTWKITQQPELSLACADGLHCSVTKNTQGIAVMAGTVRDAQGDITTVSREIYFDLDGSVLINGNTVTFSPL